MDPLGANAQEATGATDRQIVDCSGRAMRERGPVVARREGPSKRGALAPAGVPRRPTLLVPPSVSPRTPNRLRTPLSDPRARESAHWRRRGSIRGREGRPIRVRWRVQPDWRPPAANGRYAKSAGKEMSKKRPVVQLTRPISRPFRAGSWSAQVAA